MAIDFSARAIALAETSRNRRIRTLDSLRRSIDRTGLRLPRLAANPPQLGTPSATATLANGQLVSALTSPERFVLTGGVWSVAGANFPKNQVLSPITVHPGNGSDPAFAPSQGQGQRVLFSSWAPQLELLVTYGGTQGGFRLKVDGDYVYQGTLANAGDGTPNGSLRYLPLTWGDGTEAYRTERCYELEFLSSGGFGGVRVPTGYDVLPAADASQLRLMIHGDSMVSTINDANPHAAALLPAQGALLGALLGIPDCWVSNVGGTGWVNDNGGAKSTFNERLPLDVLPHRPDIIIEIGGKNDAGLTDQASFQALVDYWLDQVIASNPDTIVFMTGPIISKGGLANESPIQIAIREAKRASAARYPAHVAFIDNMAEEWATGTGSQSSPQGDGNADWCIGPDGTHFTIEGNAHCASQLARAVARAIPGLVAAQ